jgi:hypothetical protein
MFAQPVAKSQTKIAARSTARLAPHRSTLVAQFRGSAFDSASVLQHGLDQGRSQPDRNEPGFNSHDQEASWLADPTQVLLSEAAGPSWDLSKISIFPPSQQPLSEPLRLQPKLAIGAVNDPLEREADRIADQVMRMPDPELSIAPAPLKLSRKCAGCGAGSAPMANVSIPIVDGEDDFVDQPTSSASDAGVAPAAPAAPTCGTPISMSAVISGSFQGGLSMDDYYPDLAGRGYWDHGSTGGAFDTGTRAGANAQLIGAIQQIPCDPAAFSLAQTVKYVRTRRDGVRHPDEGKTMDDIAKSGRDASKPPFRQEFSAGANTWAISMADPPSVSYGPSSNIEWDRSFVTSLVGPGGRKDVNWSTSIRIVNGSVTRNTIST